MGTQVNIAAVLPAFRELASTGLRPQFEQETATYNVFNKASAQFAPAKGYRIACYFRPPTGFGGVGEGGSFNRPGAPVLDDMYVWPFGVAQAFELTGSLLANFDDTTSAIKGLSGYVAKVSESAQKEMNYCAIGDGTGVRATFKSDSSNTWTLYNSTAHTPLAGGHSTKGAVYLRVGEWYDIYDATLATYRGTVQVTAKTKTTATVNATPSGTTDTDVMVLQNSLNKLPKGLLHIINNDTGLFQLLSRSTYPEARCTVTDLNGAGIGVSTFSKTKRLLIANAGAGKAKSLVAMMSLAQDDALTRLGQNLKRWDGDAKTFDGSFDGFKHGDTMTFVDPDLDEDRVYLTVQSELKKFEQRPFGLYDNDGNEIRMRPGAAGYGSDAYTGALGTWVNYGIEEPRMHALIKRAAVSDLATQVAA